MVDNLKVNAKTKILTFKKKHNLLLDYVKELDGKQIKVYSNMNESPVDFSNDFLEKLKLGDMIYEDNDGYFGIVNYKFDDSMEIVFFGYDFILDYVYTLVDGVWEYNNNSNYGLLPSVNSSDNGKTVGVASGNWQMINMPKLYLHHLKVFKPGNFFFHIYFVSNNSNPVSDWELFNSSDKIIIKAEITQSGTVSTMILTQFGYDDTHEVFYYSGISITGTTMQAISFEEIDKSDITTYLDEVSAYN